MHQERKNKHEEEEAVPSGAKPAYLMDRTGVSRAKVRSLFSIDSYHLEQILSNTIKQKRKEKAGKYDVPLPKVRGISEDEMFKVVRTGKTRRKAWKRMVTKGSTFHS